MISCNLQLCVLFRESDGKDYKAQRKMECFEHKNNCTFHFSQNASVAAPQALLYVPGDSGAGG